jgi:predicted 3-demethylubiquinone-9 3-methyltransferase (glyoxalase superfamily)
MSKLIPSIWYKTDAREVAKVYHKIFKNSEIIRSSEINDPNGKPVHLVTMELNGLEVLLMSAEY